MICSEYDPFKLLMRISGLTLKQTIASFKSFANSIDTIYLVEASPHLREAQRSLLCGDTPFKEIGIGVESRSKYGNNQRIVWIEDSTFLPNTGESRSPFIIAHEFFDALPIHVFQSV